MWAAAWKQQCGQLAPGPLISFYFGMDFITIACSKMKISCRSQCSFTLKNVDVFSSDGTARELNHQRDCLEWVYLNPILPALTVLRVASKAHIGERYNVIEKTEDRQTRKGDQVTYGYLFRIE